MFINSTWKGEIILKKITLDTIREAANKGQFSIRGATQLPVSKLEKLGFSVLILRKAKSKAYSSELLISWEHPTKVGSLAMELNTIAKAA